ncbi:hypothetical protein H072_2961 [Dactylellina haptotyla CBS 200.50]|uniref:Uncharacterized protein n=1 Tax=Dactylellina haptotyla (strain CBS 200.50) TaxID=1284197 RepID=S8AJH6_DACHA|nr:hypothetical protein H072_2961 [Dactylellina haptotyla CBS 200.50]
MPKPKKPAINSRSDDDLFSQALSQLHHQNPPLRSRLADASVPVQNRDATGDLRYSPSPFYAPEQPGSSKVAEQDIYANYDNSYAASIDRHGEQERGVNEPQFLQSYIQPEDDLEPAHTPLTAEDNKGPFPMFSSEGPLDTFSQSFQQQLPQEFQYRDDRRLDSSLRREQLNGQTGRVVSDASNYSSQYGSVGWDSVSDFDERSVRGSQSNNVFTHQPEVENPFASTRTKARSDTEGGIRQLYRSENSRSSFHRKLHADAPNFQFPPRNQVDDDTRFTPSILQRKLDTEDFSVSQRNGARVREVIDRTPSRSVLSEGGGRFWEFQPRPSTVHGSEANPAKQAEESSQKDVKTTMAAEFAKDPISQSPATVAALKAEAIKRIQEQFKAQVAKRIEESERVIEPTTIANDAYLRMNKLGLLAHPALKLGLIHSKPDTRNVHEKFGELLKSIKIEEAFQMDQHVRLSEKLLVDLNLTGWNLLVSKDKELIPIKTPFDILGVPIPEPYGDFRNSQGMSRKWIAKKCPSKLKIKAPLSGYPMTREIQLRNDLWNTPGRYEKYVDHPIYGGRDDENTNPEDLDFQFKVAPQHWMLPDYEKNYPSAVRWEEISILKTYHQALTVQQHLYLSFLNLGPNFVLYWRHFLMAKEREAMIVRAFNLTVRMSSDDQHEWVDKEWFGLTEEQRRSWNPVSPREAASEFELATYRQVDENNFPVPFGRDTYKDVIIVPRDPQPPVKDPPERSMASYSLFCHELHPYYLARDPACLVTLLNTCLIFPDLNKFPADPEALGENYFWKPAISIKEPAKVPLGGELERNVPYMPGLPLGPNIKERVRADRTFFYSAFFYNLLTVWRDYGDEKVWFYGHGIPYRYDPNKPPELLGQPKNKFPKGEKWVDGNEIEKHVVQLQHLVDILNMGICIDRWLPEDEPAEEKVPERETWFGAKRADVNYKPPSPFTT